MRVEGGSGGSRSWGDSVATVAALPLTDAPGSVRTVLDDGDGKPASYEWNGATWTKMSDPDASGTILPLSVANGGTGGTTQALARTGIGLGNSATKDTGTTADTVAAGDDVRITSGVREVTKILPAGAAGSVDSTQNIAGKARRVHWVVDTAFDGGATGKIGTAAAAEAFVAAAVLTSVVMSTIGSEGHFDLSDDTTYATPLRLTRTGTSTVGSLRVWLEYATPAA